MNVPKNTSKHLAPFLWWVSFRLTPPSKRWALRVCLSRMLFISLNLPLLLTALLSPHRCECQYVTPAPLAFSSDDLRSLSRPKQNTACPGQTRTRRPLCKMSSACQSLYRIHIMQQDVTLVVTRKLPCADMLHKRPTVTPDLRMLHICRNAILAAISDLTTWNAPPTVADKQASRDSWRHWERH